jgi:hypothetical protein
LEYKNELVVCPTTPNEWRPIAERFLNGWKIPHACGVLDGKHIAIRCPPNVGNLYITTTKVSFLLF